MTSVAPHHLPVFGDSKRIPSTLNFPVVGLGASAGGLQAIVRFLENVPQASGMAFVVIMHLSPEHESQVDEIFQRVTGMNVVGITQLTFIERDTVYVISPNQFLELNDGYLRPLDLSRPIGRHTSIDVFFRSLAEVHRERSFAVILSGSGSDGALSLSRIKAEGGVTLCQDPDEAEYSGMPNAAIETGFVDFVLPVGDLPKKLVDLWRNAQSIKLPIIADTEKAPPESQAAPEGVEAERALREIVSHLRSRTGHDFQQYKRATVLRRIERRLQVREVPDLVTYRDLLKSDPSESTALLQDMLVGVTQFFRDYEAFSVLKNEIIPAIFAKKKDREQIRVWSAACSSGEEAYSLAMLFDEHASAKVSSSEIMIFASDIDERAIARARIGLYPAAIENDVGAARLSEYFVREDTHYRIKKQLRDKILFACQNLLRDPPFSKLDLISCRNLLIYLDRETHAQVLEIFHFALNPNGYLFLGSSETADSLQDFYVSVDKKNRIYRAKPVSRFARSGLPLAISSAILSAAAIPPPGVEKRKPQYSELHQRMLAQNAPPSVLVNHQPIILHQSEGTSQFLRHVAGELTGDILALVEPELRLELRTALYQAIQSGKSVESGRVSIQRDTRNFYVTMTAIPFHDATTASDFVLVLFQKTENAAEEQVTEHTGDKRDAILSSLEADLHRTKSQLQDTIEHSETSREELKASNEELQAINEELRSASEELETSKEELQSVNEELVTVNLELKNKIEEMTKVNDDWQNLITSTDIATIFVDRSMRIKRFTPRASDIFNLIPSDVGRPLHDITHKLEYAELAQDAHSTFESLRVVEREIASTNGRWYIVRVLPYRTVHDRIDGAILTFIDITARRLAEDEAKAGVERMRLVAASTNDYAIITTDKSGLITSFNSGAERMYGYQEQEVLGKPDDIIFTPEDRMANAPAEEKRRAREEGRAENERWPLRKDGTRFYCSGVTTPLWEDEFYGYAKIGRDLTGRLEAEKKREEQLTAEKAQRADAQAASAMKDEFLAIMSHELKHPLNLIHLNAELLQRYPAVKNEVLLMKAVSIIQSSTISQAKIIDDLLDMSRINTGKMTLNLREIDLVATTKEIVDTVKSDTTRAELSIHFECEAARLPVNADLIRVEQVLWNLLNNALKFTPRDGTITVRIRNEDAFGRIDVIDSGLGIAPELLPTVFDMFKQGVASVNRGINGLGIGLALVQQIVALHEGRVEVASDGINKGSRFSVWIPLIERPKNGTEGDSVSADSVLAGLRILLIDDTQDSLDVFQSLLELLGAKVTSTMQAKTALSILTREDFDLVISDIGMPGMDGYQFMQEMRKLARPKDLPALALTGFGRSKDVEQALAAGYTGHINKPAQINMVQAAVKKALASRV